MFSHLLLGSNDLVRSKRFYDAALGVIGVAPGTPLVFGSPRVMYRHKGFIFAVAQPLNGQPATPANGGTVGFLIDSPEQVEAFHAAALAHGGTACEDPPGKRETPAGPLYLAYVRDPDGNKLCAFHRPG
ncbi:VOC family protein [Propionivibrio sp.]|jgi:catechol 2,3-dioxygenase-like lactoylglutathione lyase family enzyme|uniref:VOC family protein n=1 Tax=Propionivibrio sp. TaxID=2212460 RepID=UPI0039E34378